MLGTQRRSVIAGSAVQLEIYVDADHVRKATDWRPISRGILMCVVSFSLGRRCLERAANGGFQVVLLRAAEQHAGFLIKPLHTEAFRFHRNLC